MSLSFLLSGLLPLSASAPVPETPEPKRLDAVEVRALGVVQPASALPVSTDVRTLDPGPAHSVVDVAGLFDGIPGVLAKDRHNRAQDLQLSIRGYGARSTFGVRGIRVLADGLPVGAPDGQSQLTQFNALSVATVEVVRGPFAALQGNASGGVVQLLSPPGQPGDPWWLQLQGGEEGERSIGAVLQGGQGQFGYRVTPLYWQGEGFRDHSRAERSSLSTRLDWAWGRQGQAMLVAQHFDAPEAQDPRSLTDAEWRRDPTLAAPTALLYNTRKSVRQDQVGLVASQDIGALRGRIAVHGGQRAVTQYLAIPASAQANPLHGGGVVGLDSDYGGMDLRLSASPSPDWEWSVGINSEGQRQHRQGWENTRGQQTGVRGALRRDQIDTVWNLDGHAQVVWHPGPGWTLQAGLRHSRVAFDSVDHYITAVNPDDSGRVAYHRSTPVAGIAFAPDAQWRWHLALGKGMETPTFNELAYRADGGAGLALDLRAARSRQWETGLRWHGNSGAELQLTRFDARTEDELGVASSQGGRSSYRNVGSTRRQGWELGSRLPLGQGDVRLAWTRLDARVTGCGVGICAGLVPGNRLPGTVRDQLQLGLEQPVGAWRWSLSATAVSAMAATDDGSAQAPGHALLGAGLSRLWPLGDQPLRWSLAVDNLLDRHHVASVVVNDGNGRYYEPGAGRTFRLGLRWDFAH